MTALFNPSPLVLGTLQNLSLVLDRSTSLARGPGVAGMAVGRSEARAFGGLAMPIARTGQSMPAKMRYGAITVTPRAQGSAFSRSPGVHPAIDRAYDNPGVRFGDRVRGESRPTSSAGETTCHFSQTSVSKTSPIREMIKAARGGRRLTGSRAAAHVLYVEREGAPEQIRGKSQERLSGEAFTAEIERRGLDRSAVAQQAYIERPGAAEGMERKPGRRITDEELDALDEASFGTIGDTVEERTRFWLAVEEAEATPKGDRVTIKPAENPAWWARVAEGVDQAPLAAQKPIRDALARADGEPFDIKLTTDKAFALHQWAVGLDTEAPLEISPGRGGRTQTRVIAELPHEIDGRERLQIVRDFTQKLAEKGFPYWAVIHAPDANNDARNFHVHIAYYDRPAAKISAPGGKDVWDFEIEDYVTYKSPNGGAKRHLTRPHQQNRLRETNSQDWVTELRKHWETVSNRVLEEAGVSKRYNLGTYESMGIDLEPLKHINSRTFNKERKGELTEEGPVLARRQWDTVHDRLVKEHEDRARKREKSIAGMADHASRLVAPQAYGSHRVAEVKRLGEMGVKASFQLALLELHQDLTRLVSDRIASRPKLIMNAADKEEQKTRKKRGEALDAPPQDRPVAGAGLFGLSRRSEVVQFLTTIYDGALRLDAENARRTETARHNVRLIVQELKNWIADPARPLHAARRYSPEGIQALDDPARAERREIQRTALQQGFREVSERQSGEILSEIAKTVADDPRSARAPQEAAARSSQAAGAPPSTAARATERRSAEPSTPAARTSRAWQSPAAAAAEPRRRNQEPVGTEGNASRSAATGLRPRPQHPLEALGLGQPSRSSGAPTAAKTPDPSAAGRPATRDAREPGPQPGASTTPSPGPSETTPARRGAETIPPATDARATPAKSPSGPAATRAETAVIQPATAPAAVVPARAAVPTTPGVTPRPTPAATAVAPKPVIKAEPTPATAGARPRTEPSQSATPKPPTGPAPATTERSPPASSAQKTAVPEARTASRSAPTTRIADGPTAAPKTGERRGGRGFAPPNVAAIMEDHGGRRSTPPVAKPKPPEPAPTPAVAPKPPEPAAELRITGAKRPEKRRRERDRGRER